MVNRNIQMKKKNNDVWENLFPITLTENVFNNEGKNLTNILEDNEEDLNNFKILTNDKIENYNTEINNQINDYNEEINNQINDYYDETNEKIDNIVKDIKDFNVIGDGIENDTINIQKALDSEYDIYWSNGKYKFDQLFLTKSNKKIEFDKQVELMSDYDEDYIQAASFEIIGEEDFSVPVIQNINKHDTEIKIGSNINDFNIGDVIFITQDKYNSETVDNHELNYANDMATIIGIDVSNNLLRLNLSLSNKYILTLNPIVTKVNPIKNIEILGNNTTFSKMGTSTYTNHFKVKYGEDIKISGFKLYSGGGKGVVLYSTINFLVENIERFKSENITAGHGYGVQASMSTFGTFNNIKTYNSRHSVDISRSYKIIVRDCYGLNCDITTHGNNSSFIDFINCTVDGTRDGDQNSFTVGNTSFLSDNNVRFIDCTSLNSKANGFGITQRSYNIEIYNSKVNYADGSGYFISNDCQNINIDGGTVSNSKIMLHCRALNVTFKNITGRIVESLAYLDTGSNWVNIQNISVFNKIGSVANNRLIYFRNLTNGEEVNINNVYARGTFTRGITVEDSILNDLNINNLNVNEVTRTVEILDTDIENFYLTNSKITSSFNLTVKNRAEIYNNRFFNNLFKINAVKGYVINNIGVAEDDDNFELTGNITFENNYK